MDQNFMKEKKVLPLVLSMSLPMMLSMLINSLYNIIDSMFVARVGEKALTAISLVYPLQTLVTSISVGFGVGISAAVAFFLGMGEHKKADQSASEGLFLSIVHGVLMSVLLTAVLPSFLRLFTTDKEIYQMGITYGTWVLSFSLVISVYIAYEKIYQSLGNMIVPTLCLAAGCLTNIVLDPILIFGIGPIPRMEVKGAAIATVIGQIVPLVMYLVWHRKKGLGVSIHIKDMKPDPAICGRLYAVGIPSSLTLGMPSLLITLLNKIAGAFSSVYVLVLGVYFKLQTFLYLPASGIVQGMRPILSFNHAGRVYAGMAVQPLQLHGDVKQLVDLRVIHAHFFEFRHLIQRFLQSRVLALNAGGNHLADAIGLRIRHLQNAGNVADNRFGLQLTIGDNLRHVVKAIFVLHIFNGFAAVFLTKVNVKVRHVNTFRI